MKTDNQVTYTGLTDIDEYLMDTHEYSDANKLIYKHFISTKIYSNVYSSLADRLSIYPKENDVLLTVFNAAYLCKAVFESDMLAMTKIDRHFITIRDSIAKHLGIRDKTDDGVLFLTVHAMCMCFCIMDLSCHTPKEWPDVLNILRIYQSIRVRDFSDHNKYERSISSFIKYYYESVCKSEEWNEMKEERLANVDFPLNRKPELEQKIVVEIFKKLFSHYGVSFRTQEKEAEFIGLATGWSKNKINGLLSSPSSLIPTRYKSKVEQLNEKLKEMGLDIELTTM